MSGLKTMVAAQIDRTQVTNVSDRSGKCSRMLADFTFLNPTKFLERFRPGSAHRPILAFVNAARLQRSCYLERALRNHRGLTSDGNKLSE